MGCFLSLREAGLVRVVGRGAEGWPRLPNRKSDLIIADSVAKQSWGASLLTRTIPC